MTAYRLARLDYKTLVCDLDPQANATQLLRGTYSLQNGTDLLISKTMMVALTEENIKSAIVNIMAKTGAYRVYTQSNYNIGLAMTLKYLGLDQVSREKMLDQIDFG